MYKFKESQKQAKNSESRRWAMSGFGKNEKKDLNVVKNMYILKKESCGNDYYINDGVEYYQLYFIHDMIN